MIVNAHPRLNGPPWARILLWSPQAPGFLTRHTALFAPASHLSFSFWERHNLAPVRHVVEHLSPFQSLPPLFASTFHPPSVPVVRYVFFPLFPCPPHGKKRFPSLSNPLVGCFLLSPSRFFLTLVYVCVSMVVLLFPTGVFVPTTSFASARVLLPSPTQRIPRRANGRGPWSLFFLPSAFWSYYSIFFESL